MNTNDIAITLPASKSLSNRWLIINHFHQGCFQLKNLSTSTDTQQLRLLLQQLRRGSDSPYFCGNAGTVARFMMAVLAISSGTHFLTGDARLKQRPMADLIEALRGLGFSIRCVEREGFLPVEIVGGNPTRKMAFINPTLSSQFVSALMLMAPELPGGMTITLTDRAASRPYIDMTRLLLKQTGVEISISANKRVYSIPCRIQKPKLQSVSIESDWSAASYFYLAAALLGGRRVRLKGLSLDTVQGDVVVAEMFSHLGVKTSVVRSPYRHNITSLTLTATQPPEPKVAFNFLDYPDLLPAVAVACAALQIEAHLRGIRNLRYKETDRIEAVSTELSKMGANLKVTDTEIYIKPSKLHPVGPVSTYGDHRIAMAFAPLRLLFPDLEIENPEVVEKSFPDFWNQFKLCFSAK